MGNLTPKSYHDVRSDMRFPIQFRAILHWGGTFASVEVADVADFGLRFIGPLLPDIGATVRIVAKGFDESGHVMWRTEHSCGVKLTRRINALSLIRANCFASRQRADCERPLGAIPNTALASALATIFSREDHVSSPFATDKQAQSGSRFHNLRRDH